MRSLVDFADISVVAPVPYYPAWFRFNERWRTWARVPRAEDLGGFHTQHPRYIVLPKMGMAIHGVSMFAGTFLEMFKRLKTADYDLIDAHYVYPDGFAAMLLAGMLKKPVVVSARGSDINQFSEFKIIRPLIQQVLLRANGLIAVSQSLKDKMVQLGCGTDNLAVVGNGVDSQKFRPRPRMEMRQKLGLPSDRPIVLGVGNLNQNKGFHILIEAVSRLRSRGIILLIIGEGPRRSDLEQQVMKAGLKDTVKLIGTIPHGELSAWYSAADVLCLASAREGCPNVVLEAMACGLPVVGTRVGGIPELVVSPAFGTLVERSPEAFEAALADALTRQWPHEAIVVHARSHGWDKVSAQVMDVYSTAVARFHAHA